MFSVVVTQDVLMLISIEIHTESITHYRRTTNTIYPALVFYSDIRFEMVMLCLMNKEIELYLHMPSHVIEIIKRCLRNLLSVENQYLNKAVFFLTIHKTYILLYKYPIKKLRSGGDTAYI
eukprot:379541_1